MREMCPKFRPCSQANKIRLLISHRSRKLSLPAL
ncbi:hypothetical protein DFQ15_11892 [Xylophilus ampelinus]|uniref:Uncharacterized protein n=1 Tax=Xylophilus ampelinus TaxID=54067 RepID=A0A318SEF7_9BURK|nr:hypothetical protein DFQ15_11892 [Xylophilus ampelinus]